MNLLIVYATSEGHTARIARHIGEKQAAAGRATMILPVSEADIDAVDWADAIIIAAPVHANHFPHDLAVFLVNAKRAIDETRAMFLSVSLTAAGHDAEDWQGLDQIVGILLDATEFTPAETIHVAGAYAPSKLDPVRRFIMRRIIAARDPAADLSLDHIYTDWDALDRDVAAFLGAG